MQPLYRYQQQAPDVTAGTWRLAPHWFPDSWVCMSVVELSSDVVLLGLESGVDSSQCINHLEVHGDRAAKRNPVVFFNDVSP